MYEYRSNPDETAVKRLYRINSIANNEIPVKDTPIMALGPFRDTLSRYPNGKPRKVWFVCVGDQWIRRYDKAPTATRQWVKTYGSLLCWNYARLRVKKLIKTFESLEQAPYIKIRPRNYK